MIKGNRPLPQAVLTRVLSNQKRNDCRNSLRIVFKLSAESFAQKNRVLDAWCARFDRKPGQIERTVAINAGEVDTWPAYLDAGADHLIVMVGPPFDIAPVERLLRAARD